MMAVQEPFGYSLGVAGFGSKRVPSSWEQAPLGRHTKGSQFRSPLMVTRLSLVEIKITMIRVPLGYSRGLPVSGSSKEVSWWALMPSEERSRGTLCRFRLMAIPPSLADMEIT